MESKSCAGSVGPGHCKLDTTEIIISYRHSHSPPFLPCQNASIENKRKKKIPCHFLFVCFFPINVDRIFCRFSERKSTDGKWEIAGAFISVSSKGLWQKMVSIVWIPGHLLKLSVISIFLLSSDECWECSLLLPLGHRVINLTSLCPGGIGLSFPTFKSLGWAVTITQSRTEHNWTLCKYLNHVLPPCHCNFSFYFFLTVVA